jgi:hypothetical protein
VPLVQSDRTLLFANARGRFDDSDSIEGNFGLGLRRMLDGGWNLGGYAYFDRLRSEQHNVFHQTTLGLEALGRDWDVRVNGYVPVGERIKNVDSLSTAELSGTTVVFRGGEERGLAGFDAEVGWRVPFWRADALQALRIYAGGFRFGDDVVKTVAGPRGRLELTFDQVPGLWEGARLALGTEVQHDDVRGTQTFFTVQLRIPLEPGKEQPSRLTAQERHMTTPVVRDVDIVSQAGAFGAPETAYSTLNGQPIQSVSTLNSATTTGAALPGAVTAAGANSTVILSGTFNTTAVTTLQVGQTLMSGGGTLTVRSASGRTATFTVPGSSGTVAATGNIVSAINVASNSVLSGLTVSNRRTVGNAAAVNSVGGATGATIRNNTITAAGTTDSDMEMTALAVGSNFTVSGNTLNASSTGGGGASAATGLAASNRTNVTVTGNTFNSTGAVSNFSVSGNAVTSFVTASSTGNVLTSGTCNAGAATGSVSFTNGTTCP